MIKRLLWGAVALVLILVIGVPAFLAMKDLWKYQERLNMLKKISR